MSIALRLIGVPDGTTRPTSRPPVPIQYRFTEREGSNGIETEFIIVFHNADAQACHRCPLARCTFVPTEEGIGTCKVKADGRLARAVALLGL